MSRYAVLLHARNLRLLNQAGRAVPGGVYTWRVVEGETPGEAGELARSKLLADEHFLTEIWNTPEEPPEIGIDEISEVESEGAKDSGLVYYFENETDAPYGAEEERG